MSEKQPTQAVLRCFCIGFALSLTLLVGCLRTAYNNPYTTSTGCRGNPFDRDTYVQTSNPFDRETYVQTTNPFNRETYKQTTNPFDKETYIQNTNPFDKETYRQGPFFHCPE